MCWVFSCNNRMVREGSLMAWNKQMGRKDAERYPGTE